MNVCGSVRRGKKRDNNNTRAERRCGKPDWRTHDEFSTPTKVGRMTRGESPQRLAVVTGASSGIGEATARTLAGLGFHVVCVARREDRIRALADEIGGTATVADVTDPESVDALVAEVDRAPGKLYVLVNNAGGAKGAEPVADADLEHWRWMWETNVMGTLRVTRALLPKLVDSGDGLIVTITSIAAFEIYDGGAGYTSAKHAQSALHRTLRGELLGKPVRLTEIAPGMVETEFSVVRFGGDKDKADALYQGLTPLVAADIADVIGFVASRPSHVNLDQIVIRPRDQASATRKFTRPETS
jgi:NADP-dependent 3-hydroxy acid dehydrogenase YdfG